MPEFKNSDFQKIKIDENKKIGEIVDNVADKHLEKSKSSEEVVLMFAHQYAETENLIAKYGFEQDTIEDQLLNFQLERDDLEDLLDDINKDKKGVSTIEKGEEELFGETASERLQKNISKFEKLTEKLKIVTKGFKTLCDHRDEILANAKEFLPNGDDMVKKVAQSLEEQYALNPDPEMN